MVNVAIVEDSPEAMQKLHELILKYGEENGVKFMISKYSNAVDFLENYTIHFDIVFMDIDMPGFSGMDAAKRLRKIDNEVNLIFVTNMEQYALKSYDVSALDFMLKPVNYVRLSVAMKKAFKFIAGEFKAELYVRTKGGMKYIHPYAIIYLDIRDHCVLYHTDDGVIESWARLSDVENELEKYGFIRCNKGEIVNMKRILRTDGDTVFVEGHEIALSRGRKKIFKQKFVEFIGR